MAARKCSAPIDRRLDVFPGKRAAFCRNGADQASGKDRGRGHLIVEDVGARFADNFLPGTGQQAQSDLVAHGAGGHKQRGFAAEHRCRAVLKQVDGGVFAINVVADFGRRHRGAHLRRRPGNRIRT